jgi:2,3-bisphosphoglycerate-dependent phosphoglycerate mutase
LTRRVKTLVLARHAAAGSNRDGLAWSSIPGEGLTQEGVAQARRLRAELADQEIDLGVATDLLRTQETLEVALEGRTEVPRLVVSELNEIDFGDFDGGPLADYRAWAGSNEPMVEAPGRGESRAAAAARFAAGLRLVLERSEENVLLVGHALCIRYFLDATQGLVPAPLMVPLEHAVPYRVTAEEARAAALLLEEWSHAPRFRPLSVPAQ